MNNISILYVEDEDGIRKQLTRFLEYFSTSLYLASNGKEGLALYKEHSPDIVISDIKMPNMNGIEMAQSIKTINPNQHIIFTTAHSESRFFLEAIEMQVDGYILKPIDYKLLKSKISSILEQIRIKKQFLIQEKLIYEITQLQDDILFVLDKDLKVIFSNKKFLNFFQVHSTQEFNEQHQQVSNLFQDKNDYFYPTHPKKWIEEIQKIEDEDKRVISIINKDNQEITFLVSLKHISETNHSILLFIDITNIACEKNKFIKKAYTDELTKIPNRRYFEEKFSKIFWDAKKDNIALSFILFDIDKFKNFNDKYGHQVGDLILKELAQIVKKHTRENDIFVRWGGEEFVQVLPFTTLKEAESIAQNLRKVIEKNTFTNQLMVTCSFGVSSLGVYDTSDNLIKNADIALYEAKNSGRNKVITKQ